MTEPSIRINKYELEAFLSELLEFTRRFKQVLVQLDATEAKVGVTSEQVRKKISKSSNALNQIGDAITNMCIQTEEQLGGTVNE